MEIYQSKKESRQSVLTYQRFVESGRAAVFVFGSSVIDYPAEVSVQQAQL